MTWSPESVDMGIQSLLFQIYPILLSTLLSINRQQLSLADAHFVISVSSSPLMLYLVVASIGELVGIKTGLYKRIKSNRLIIRALGAMVLPLWTGLSMTTSMSGKAFKDSSCSKTDFKTWFMDLGSLLLNSIAFPGFLSLFSGPLLTILITLFVTRVLSKCRDQVVLEIRAYLGGVSKPWGRLLMPWVFVKCAWYAPIVVTL